MKEMTLNDYVDQFGQTATAEKLNLTQGAVWQMLKNQRSVFIVKLPNGQLEAFEKKPVGRRAV